MSAEKPGQWPLEPSEVAEWMASVAWRDAVTKPMNPHSYHLKRGTPNPKMFEMVVLHIREHGFQEYFGAREYTYLEIEGYHYWTMMEPLEWTIIINRKQLPKGADVPDEEEQPNMSEQLPEVFTSRYLATDILASGAVTPVRVSMYPPAPLLGELPYPLEHEIRDLMPERPMYGDWRTFSPLFWKKLEHIGPEKIATQLATISAKDGRKPLALCCYEDLLRGQMCHRTIFSAWWREQTGQEICELTNDGEVLKLEQLHHQVQPLRPR